MEYNSPYNTDPSAPPSYYPPAFNVGYTSPLQPILNPPGTQNNKAGQMQMQMNGMLNPANLMNQNHGGPMPAASGPNPNGQNPAPMQTTQIIVGGPGMQYFSPSPRPISMTCPHCKHDMVTQIQYNTSCLTHTVAGVLCFVGCICCFYIPYLFDSFKDVEHSCSNCGRFIGIYKRM